MTTLSVSSPSHAPAAVAGLPQSLAFVDGAIVPISEAKISMLDWGFLHSDATYDVAQVWDGRFFRLDDHLTRFEDGMANLRMSLPYSRSQIRQILVTLVQRSGLRNAYVEVICTRGVPAPGSRDPRECTNRFYAFAVPFVWIANPEQRERGLRLHVSEVRRIAPESVDPTVKNYHWLDLVRGLFDAYDHGQETAALSDGAGNVVEGAGFNVFAITDGIVVTPKDGVLRGVTRKTAMELAARMGLRVEERALPVQELELADEVFITSSAGGIMPVGWVNGVAIGKGGAGPETARLRDAYWALHSDPRYSFAVFKD